MTISFGARFHKYNRKAAQRRKMGIVVKVGRYRSWTAIGSCVAFAITLLSCSYLSKSHPDERMVSAAQDEVYEAVMREFTAPGLGRTLNSQLVFDAALLINERAGIGPEGCNETVRRQPPLGAATPPYNSWYDKAYRFVTRGWGDGSVGKQAMKDYLRQLCVPGQLSTTFRTDLPRTFISGETVHFEGWPVETNGPPSFEKLFPGAGGIIAFSRVGLNPALDEAVVFRSFVCGGLCGSGWRYFLKKRRGKWQITDEKMIWVS